MVASGDTRFVNENIHARPPPAASRMTFPNTVSERVLPSSDRGGFSQLWVGRLTGFATHLFENNEVSLDFHGSPMPSD
jgi:hypothetical protein